MHICLNHGTASAPTLEQFVALAAHAGFQGADVDLNYAVQHGTAALADLYAKHNLKFGGFGPAADFRGDKSKFADGLALLEKHAKIARELNIDSCATWIMPSSDLPFLDNWKFHVEGIKPIAKILADHGLRFGMEFVAPFHLRRMHKHEFIFTPGLMLEIAADIGPNVGLLVDCFHLHCAAEPFDYLAKIPADKIVLAHLNDAPDVETFDVKDGERLLPGDGVIDGRTYLAALQAAGYDGPVSVEVFNSGLREMAATEAAKKAWAATKRIL